MIKNISYRRTSRTRTQQSLKFNLLIFIGFLALVGMVCLNVYTITNVQIEIDKTNAILNIIASEELITNSSSSANVGNYNNPLQLIRVWGKYRNPYDVWRTCNHEHAHYLYYTFLDAKAITEYELIFNSTDEFVTDYAETKHREDFAETFQEGMVFCFDLKKIPEDRQEYFRKHVLPLFPECDVR